MNFEVFNDNLYSELCNILEMQIKESWIWERGTLIKNQDLFAALLFLVFSMDWSHLTIGNQNVEEKSRGIYQAYRMIDQVLHGLKKVDEKFEEELKGLV